MKLTGKTAVVTGAAGGIGAASAELLAAEGAQVVVSDIDLSRAEKTAATIIEKGQKALAVQTNVTQYEAVEELFTKANEHFGSLDILVNNAGIGGDNQLKTAEHTLEDWHNVIAVNQTGVFYGMRAALRIMEKQGHGNIVNIASLAGLKASGNNLSYSASKFAVVGMTKSAALEYGRKNIRINAVCPGYTNSALLDKLLASKAELGSILQKMTPMKRFGEAHEIAEAVLWLASDNTSFITGQTITLDGGLSL